jgi:uncharacterized membrane protein YhaH (DUF805 family)
MSMDNTGQGQAIDWQKLFLSFDGRIRRQHFWIAWLICLGVGFVSNFLPFLGALIGVALIWPNLAIMVKRLHDMGKPGWFAAIPYIVAIVAGIVAFATMGAALFSNASALENEDPAAIMALMGPAMGIFLVAFLINIAFLLWIGITDSQPGTNRYGPNPKNPATTAEMLG